MPMAEPLIARHSLVMAAERERVWRAITGPQHFSKWFGMPVQLDRLAVGGHLRFVEIPGSPPCVITAVEPPERFAFNWTPEPGCPVTTLVTFYLEKVDEGTRVTVTEQGFEDLPEKLRKPRFELNSEGWSIQLTNLDTYLKEVTAIGED
jgi:uncharacterized protein YndB with AHSA1/START domain